MTRFLRVGGGDIPSGMIEKRANPMKTKDNIPTSSPLRDEERTPCEVWTRVVGYHRPISQFNRGKQNEHRDRIHFHEPQGDDARPARAIDR